MGEAVSTEREATCTNVAEHHQPGIPDGYIQRAEWFRLMGKTHRQTQCSGCGLYVVWVPKVKCVACGRLIVNLGLHMDRYHRGGR
jgi:hypothetical protein